MYLISRSDAWHSTWRTRSFKSHHCFFIYKIALAVNTIVQDQTAQIGGASGLALHISPHYWSESILPSEYYKQNGQFASSIQSPPITRTVKTPTSFTSFVKAAFTSLTDMFIFKYAASSSSSLFIFFLLLTYSWL